jgi:hypothetical protein
MAHILCDIVNLEHYVNHIWTPTEVEKQYLYFQQGNFSSPLITAPYGCPWCKELWPPCLPDLSACSFHVWENLKGKVYKEQFFQSKGPYSEIVSVIHSNTEGELQ